jgi:hypothetical protein
MAGEERVPDAAVNAICGNDQIGGIFATTARPIIRDDRFS